MTYLFTKDGCKKCDWVKGKIDLASVAGLQILTLDGENAEALAMLAYYECVTLAEKKLPILVSDDEEVITGAVQIRNHLQGRVS
jgi:hypothetical protein